MKKNIVTIIFLFLVIFVTLMFGQDVEQFAAIDQTDGTGSSGRVGQGTYFTKEDGAGTNAVSVFSALRNFSNASNDMMNENIYKPSGVLNSDGTTKCTDAMCYENYYMNLMPLPNEQNLSQKQINFNAAASNLSSAVGKNANITISPAASLATQSAILSTHASNKEIQQDLDRKMSELLNDNTGMKLESATKKNSTMYVNIAFTVLATTALYYIFVKI